MTNEKKLNQEERLVCPKTPITFLDLDFIRLVCIRTRWTEKTEYRKNKESIANYALCISSRGLNRSNMFKSRK
jgi:hypothetical protein